MRIFTAIPVPERTKKIISEITQGRLPVPYVNTSNLHLTLNFFGEVNDDQIDLIKGRLAELIDGVPGFYVKFTDIIKFHNQIHLVVEPAKPLLGLQNALEKGFVKTGFVFQNRPYYPHVKLANLHMDNVMNPDRKIANFPKKELAGLTFKAASIVLYESKLLLHHVHHNPLLESKLR